VTTGFFESSWGIGRPLSIMGAGRIMGDIAASYAHLAELTCDYCEAAKAAAEQVRWDRGC